MNLVEYLIAACLLVMAIGAWMLINAYRKAEDAFENELGYQLGIAPPVKSLDALPGFVPSTPPPAIVTEMVPFKPRRPPSSKPPMLPAGMTVADFDTRQTGAPWMQKQTTDSNPTVSSESQAATPATPPANTDTTAKP